MDTPTILNHENAGRILNEGWRLFQQKGYRGVTIDELCLRCGITKPTLYYYFQDKESLFVQVLEQRLRGFHAVIEQPGATAERLARVAASILDAFQVEYNTLLRDREHLKKPESLRSVREAFHRELFGPLSALMQSGIAQGELKAENPELLTLVFLGMINNLIGKAAEWQTDNVALGQKCAGYFLEGAKKQ